MITPGQLLDALSARKPDEVDIGFLLMKDIITVELILPKKDRGIFIKRTQLHQEHLESVGSMMAGTMAKIMIQTFLDEVGTKEEQHEDC